MALDLLLRRPIAGSCARDDLRSPSLGILPPVAAIAVVLFPHLVRRREIRHYRRHFDDGLSATQELPAISMRDLIYGGDQ